MRLVHRLLRDIGAQLFEETANHGWETFDSADDYSEPGYSTDRPGGIVFADWNGSRGSDSPQDKLRARIARWGSLADDAEWAELEWSDQWTLCDDCRRAVRISPDSYSWTPSYFLSEDGHTSCHACTLEDPTDLEKCLTNDPTRADTLGIDWGERGWTRVEGDFENGFHPGQNDNPQEIANGVDGSRFDFLFEIESVGQFDMRFCLWTRPVGWEDD